MEKPSTSNLFALIVCGLFAVGSFALAGSEHILWWAGWTDEGPWSEDFFFILHGRYGKGVAISNDLAVRYGLVATLQERLAGLDNKAIIDASASTEVRRFLVWQKMG